MVNKIKTSFDIYITEKALAVFFVPDYILLKTKLDKYAIVEYEL